MKEYKNAVQSIQSMVDQLNSDILFASDAVKKDYYAVVLRGSIIARIYKISDQWYIWYENLGIREKTATFTEAMHTIEHEFARKRK